ncbi:hypothetical protein F9L00_15270 [Brucella anthropi]|nr:hypothetical protein F9K90_17510 [Brucella anthropi]KAB2753167.1 hypothetical protein F9K95_04805 [Brucella anthropi]KAB2761227.1 hypothetical protein F9K98_18095 [Brucella anthropi]KAB2776688.1 hypothetical protein F9L00_15270 [Brucella anthropi]KAB2783982.1 hypothetical protein F9K99_05570 [Brucella anthropi]
MAPDRRVGGVGRASRLGVSFAIISALTACKWHSSALPVLMYHKVHSAPVLEDHHFRLVSTKILTKLGA